MDAELTHDFRRRMFAIQTPSGPGEIAAIEFGDMARPIEVIFVHANGFNAMTYRSVLAPLGERLHILAIDQQGHGRSPQRIPSLDRNDWLLFRDDLVAVLAQLGDHPLLLSGHSMGGTASVLASAARPGRVKGLALFDPVIVGQDAMRRIASGEAPAFSQSPLALGAAKRRAVFASRAIAGAAPSPPGLTRRCGTICGTACANVRTGKLSCPARRTGRRPTSPVTRMIPGARCTRFARR